MTLEDKLFRLDRINHELTGFESSLRRLKDEEKNLSEMLAIEENNKKYSRIAAEYQIIMTRIAVIEKVINKLSGEKTGVIKEIKKLRGIGSLEFLSKDKYIKRALNKIIHKRKKKGFVTYDALYAQIPDHVVSADMIDELRDHLEKNNIRVLDKPVRKQIDTKQVSKFEDEIATYGIDVENQLTMLFKGSNKTRQSDGMQSKPSDIGANTKVSTNEERRDEVRMSMPRLPRITDVSPMVVDENTWLLVSKVRVREKKLSLYNRNNTIEQIVREDDVTVEGQEFKEEPIPKVYSRVRFDNDRRLSLFAKAVGDRAEEIVIRFLQEILVSGEKSTIKWVSRDGETPGWDIEYRSVNNM